MVPTHPECCLQVQASHGIALQDILQILPSSIMIKFYMALIRPLMEYTMLVQLKDRKTIYLFEMVCTYDALLEEWQSEKAAKYDDTAAGILGEDSCTSYWGYGLDR